MSRYEDPKDLVREIFFAHTVFQRENNTMSNRLLARNAAFIFLDDLTEKIRNQFGYIVAWNHVNQTRQGIDLRVHKARSTEVIELTDGELDELREFLGVKKFRKTETGHLFHNKY